MEERAHVVILVSTFYGQRYLTQRAELAEGPILHVFVVAVQGKRFSHVTFSK